MTFPAVPADWSPERLAELDRLWREGLTTAEIGRRLGVSKNTVVGKAHRLHLPARPNPIKTRRGPRPDGEKVKLGHVAAAKFNGHPMAATPKPAGPVAAAPRRESPDRIARYAALGTAATGACAWPIGDPGTPEFRSCGDRPAAGKPYCARHCAVAYVRERPKGAAGAEAP